MSGSTARWIDDEAPPLMTVEEFLRWPGDGTGRRFELVDGEVRAQYPASDTHGQIHTNLTLVIGAHLRANRPGRRVVTEPGIAPRLNANWNYREPELGVTCAPNRPGVHMLPDPVLLIEVLSPSNRRRTWSNVPPYASVPTVTEILLVESTEIKALLLRRGPDGTWPPDPAAVPQGGSIELQSIGLLLPLAELYRDTYLGEA